MVQQPVIIFGASGNVGRVAAATAEVRGAKVTLAMRNTSKDIPGIKKDDTGFTRIQADLTKPDTVSAAVKESGAKKAFIYSVKESTDHMKGSIQALKDSGIDYVVFLSSYSIAEDGGELESVPKEHFIAYVHARIELSLREVFGVEHFTAIRAGGFATNLMTFMSGSGIKAGHVDMFGPDFKSDCVSPDDIGEVAGSILVQGSSSKNVVYVFGPTALTQRQQVETVAKVLNKEVTISVLTSPEEAVAKYKSMGMPDQTANLVVKILGKSDPAFIEKQPELSKEGAKNVQEFAGHPPTSFEAYVRAHKADFQ